MTLTLFSFRNVEDTKPSSSTTMPEVAKPGLTLNPLTGLPYTKKYIK